MTASVINLIMPPDEPIPTRASLLARLKNLGDQASWNAFYEIYHDLIFSVARRAGLNETEADEVVQDTLISVARKMPEFAYDPAKDSFKGWLLTVVRWRVRDQLAKRSHEASARSWSTCSEHEEQESRTATVDRVADQATQLESIWNEEWESQLLQT